jgi:acetolactate synthase-1/2/3 large subunit
MKRSPRNRTVAAWLMEGLLERGVHFIATLCGHGLDPLFAAARDAGIRLVDVRNEQTAGYIADAFGRLTGAPGVCASSSGVAVANALTGVVNAWLDGSPMLMIRHGRFSGPRSNSVGRTRDELLAPPRIPHASAPDAG